VAAVTNKNRLFAPTKEGPPRRDVIYLTLSSPDCGLVDHATDQIRLYASRRRLSVKGPVAEKHPAQLRPPGESRRRQMLHYRRLRLSGVNGGHAEELRTMPLPRGVFVEVRHRFNDPPESE